MITFFRNNIRKFAIFLWIAVIAFVIGGAYLFVRGPFRMGSNTAIQVGDMKISMPTYEQTYNNIYKFYVQMLTQIKGGNVTDSDIKKLNIKKKTIDTLVQRALLLQEAHKEGIKVTDEDVEKKIESNTMFYLNGHFSKRKYLAILKANGINPRSYEDSIKTSLYIDKLKSKVLKNVKVKPEEVKKYFVENYSKVDLKYVYLPFKEMRKKVKVTDKDLKAFYDKHKEEFRVPTQIKFKYTLIDVNYAKSKIKVSDNQSREFYKDHISYFMVPLRIKVAHILIGNNPNDNKTDEQLKKEAYKIYDELKNNKITFKEAAKKYSSDTYSKNVGGELGYVSKKMVVPGFWEGIKNLKVGEISKPFKSKFGYHIAKVEDIKKPYTKKYAEVKNEIVNYLKTSQAKENLFIYAKKVFVKIRDSKKGFDDAIKSLGLKVNVSDYMSLKSPKPPFTAAILRTALMSQTGQLLGPDMGEGGYVIYEIVSKKPSYIPALDKIKDKVKQAYIKYKAMDIARQTAEQIYDKLKSKEPFDKAAKELGLKVYVAKNVGKFSPDDKMKCTQNSVIMKKIFENKVGFFDKCSVNDGIYVYVISKKTVNEKDFNKYKKSIEEQLKSQKDFEAMNRFIAKLKRGVKIKINPKL